MNDKNTTQSGFIQHYFFAVLRQQKNSAGFTLVETIVAVTIFSLMMIVVSWSIVSFYKANNYTVYQSAAINSARKGVETLVMEIREATYSDTGAYPIVSASHDEFTFYSDIDKDTDIERIHYFLDGTNLNKGTSEASGNPRAYPPGDATVKTLSEFIRNPIGNYIFTYYDSSGNEVIDLSNITDIVLVRVNLVVNVVQGRAPNEFTLRSNAQLRNLKNNL